MERYGGTSTRKYNLMQIKEIRDKIEASIPEQQGIDCYVYTPEQWETIKEQRASNAANISRLIDKMQDNNEYTTPARVSWPACMIEELEQGIKSEWIEGEWHCDRETLTLKRDEGRTLIYIPNMPESISKLVKERLTQTQPHYYVTPFKGSGTLLNSIQYRLSH